MDEQEYKKEINKLKANLWYYKKSNQIIKKQNSFLRYDIRLLEIKLKRVKKSNQEKDYLIMELLKKREDKHD
jgi:hypothetical protein